MKLHSCYVSKNNEVKILKQAYSLLEIAGPRKFKIRDIVRISKKKSVF